MKLIMVLVMAMLAGPVSAQHAGHGSGGHDSHGTQSSTVAPVQPGQSAFAAIQEIVEILRADPMTDWAQVDIDGLRAHLVDMDNVTLRAKVQRQPIKGGMAFLVSSEDPEIIASIQRMVVAHAQVMNGVDGLNMRASQRPYGAMLGVVGDEDRIKGLGFFGLMATGMHHQAHHLAMARGGHPHQ